MEGAFIALIALAFGFIVCNAINHKKIDIISAILFVILCCLACIKLFDEQYYQDKFSSIENFMTYCVAASGLLLLTSLVGYFLGYKKYIKSLQKEEVKMTEEQPINLSHENEIIKEEQFNAYLEMFDEPVAFLLNNQYRLNSAMKKVIHLDLMTVSKEQLYSLVNFEDRKNLHLNSLENQSFRFKTQENIWFSEQKAIINKTEYRMIREMKNSLTSKIKISSFKDLTIKLEQICQNDEDFSLILFNVMNYSDIYGFYGKDFADLAIGKYLQTLHNLPYMNDIQMFYIGATEYAVLVKNIQEYDIILRDLEKDTSSLLSCDLQIGQIKVNLKSRVAVINSLEIIDKNAREVTNIAFEMIQMVTSKDYPGEFVIYKPLSEKNKNYSLEDMNINLDIDLKKYLDRLK